MLANDNHSEVDFILALIMGVMGTMLAVTGYLLKNKFQLYDKHLEASVTDARLLDSVDRLLADHIEREEDRVKDDSAEFHWLGDCMVTMAAKLDIDIPPRPQP